MQKLRRFNALFWKETLQIIRDPSSILIAVILPLILLFLMGYAISLDSKNIPVGMVVEKSSKHTQSLVDAFALSPSFDVKLGKNRQEFNEQIQKGTLRAIIVIPETFAKDLLNHSVKIQILADGTEPNIAGYVQKYSHEVWQNWLQQEGLRPTDTWGYRDTKQILVQCTALQPLFSSARCHCHYLDTDRYTC